MHKFIHTALIGIVLFGATQITKAQDLRFSQYNLSPLVLNPALTGFFPGDYRFSAIYRSQWGNRNSLFSTPAISFDMPIEVAFASSDAIGAGIYIANDNEGGGILSTQHIMLSGAYHKNLDDDQRHTLSFGVQLGYVQKSVDQTKLIFGDQYDQGTASFSNQSNEMFNSSLSYFNVNLGFNYFFKASDVLKLNAGLVFDNIIQPKESFYEPTSNGVNRRSVKPVYLLGAEYDLNPKITLEPGLRILTQSKSSDIFLGSNIGYHLNNSIGLTIWGGAWYRIKESVVLSFGMEVKKIRVGFSYDTNVHGLSGSNLDNVKNAKSYEIGAVVILPIFQSIDEVIVPCLRF